MADIKITDLAAYTNPVSTDVLPIVDLGSDLTKKVSIADLLENAGTGNVTAPSFSFDGDNDTGIYQPGLDQIAISTGGIQRLQVDSSGNVHVGGTIPNLSHIALNADGSASFASRVGIGTSSPGANLQVVPSAVDTDIFAIRRQDSASTNLFRFFQDSAITGGTGGAHLNTSNRSLAITASGAGSTDDGIFIKTLGEVGIGTANPTQKLHVIGNQTRLFIDSTNSSSNTGVSFGNNGTTVGGVLYSNSDDALRFQTNGTTERARLTSSGNMLIGGTLPSAPNISLNADGSAKFVGGIDIYTVNTGSTTTSGVSLSAAGKVTAQRTNASNDTDRNFKSYKGTTETFATQTDGTVLIGGDLTHPLNPLPNIKLGADGNIKAVGLAASGRVYADNTAAKAGGLVDGDFYRKSDGTLMVVFT